MTIVDVPLVARSASERGHVDRSTAPWAAAAGLAAVALVGTTAYLPDVRVENLPLGTTTGWFSSPWNFDQEVVVPAIIADSGVDRQSSELNIGTAATLKQVRERAGLTWDQISRLFGVSRRAVHLWAAGGRMTAGNEETLLRVSGVLAATAHSPESEVRRAVLGLLEEARSTRGSSDRDINRPASTWNEQPRALESD